ncbi:MAG: helix-turn-helix transcriptional regulator [Actinobacteria bacterium]|nr:helix-turn-helix transcriptional regulator [Actinomycetota bacterium]
MRSMEDAVELSRRLKEARRELGLSQAAAAERMEISPAYLSRMENLSCNPPSARARRRIESFLTEAARKRKVAHGSDSSAGAAPGGAPVSPGGALSGGGDHSAPMEESDADASAEDVGKTTQVVGGEWAVEGEARIDDSEEGMHEISIAGARGRRAALIRELLTHSLRLGEEDLGLLAEVARSLREKGKTCDR